MDQYDATAESLTSRIERLAEQISQRAQTSASTFEPFFIDNIFHAVENAAGDVVNATADAVNAAVNATHDAVNAIANVGRQAADLTDDAIHATENIVNAVTAHTDVIHNVANVTLEAIHATPDIADFIGFSPFVEGGEKATAGEQGAARASAAQLIQARRLLLREKSKSLAAQTAAKRSEIKQQISAISDSIAVKRRSSQP